MFQFVFFKKLRKITWVDPFAYSYAKKCTITLAATFNIMAITISLK